MDRNLQILRGECKKNETTPEEAQFYNDFFYQIVIAEKTVEHCTELLKAHNGDAERELVKALKENNVDIKSYYGSSFADNHCMYYEENGDKIINGTTKAMKPKIRDVCNRKYLGAIGVAIKNILRLWYKVMRTMKSVEFQSDEDWRGFDKNVKEMNKAVHAPITSPPAPGCLLKHSKGLKFHLFIWWGN